jgi:hypothetical protein
MFEALLSRLRGAFDFDVLKPIFPVFYVAMLVSTYAAVRSRASRRLALWTALLLGILPELATAQSPGGSADMPEAAFVAGTIAASFRRESRRAAPFLIGSLTVVKPEGTVLALIASAAVLGLWSRGGLRHLLRRLRIHAADIGIVAVFLLLRLGFLRWYGIDDRTYSHIDASSLSRALDRVGLVVSTAAGLALDPAVWGVLWPLFLVAGLALGRLGSPAERCLVGAVLAALAAYTAIFLFTNWNVPLHLRQAYTRLLAQIAPAAAIAIALSYERVHRRLTRAATATRVGP